MPSKLFTYSLTGKPLMVCLHAQSQAKQYFGGTPDIGTLIEFGETSKQSCERNLEAMASFLEDASKRVILDRSKILAPYLSPAAALRHAELFNRCLPTSDLK